MSMSNIEVGRYECLDDWSGWIESKGSDGVGWIIFLDDSGRPSAYWPQRDAAGGVIGEPINICTPAPN